MSGSAVALLAFGFVVFLVALFGLVALLTRYVRKKEHEWRS